MAALDPECIFTQLFFAETEGDPAALSMPDYIAPDIPDGVPESEIDDAVIGEAMEKEACPRVACRLNVGAICGYMLTGNVETLDVIAQQVASDCAWHDVPHGDIV